MSFIWREQLHRWYTPTYAAGGGSRHSRLISFTAKQNLHDFRYEGGVPPINSGFQIPVVKEKREYDSSQ